MFERFKNKMPGPETSASNAAGGFEQSPAAPGTRIHYEPELIAQLKGDHQRLLDLYQQIQEKFEEGDYTAVSKQLDQFRVALQGHLLTENVRLYVYLDHCLGATESNAELIHGFRREMEKIGRDVMNFLRKYRAIGVDRELAPAFSKDFAVVGEKLTERIEREEQVLYPLYMPVSAFSP